MEQKTLLELSGMKVGLVLQMMAKQMREATETI